MVLRAGLLRHLACVLALALPGFLAACSSTRPPEGLTAVTPFDIQSYQGRWYEVARLDHSFERGLSDVTAQYSLQKDGSVRVVNRGYDAAKGGWNEAVGRALFTGETRTGSLKVSFFGPFYGGYHVIALDKGYQWAVVVGPDRGYCWILSRSKTISPALRSDLTARVRAAGINPDDLIWMSQQRQDPAS
ncbi:lipocalin family protein [Amphibiibacter pelophylacis]|uniref:Lipocalin family protein n=1 Tax=Amphibiibacter pelophylacis TaxID=1799477 RepID=A0ACC6NZQ1_9BURK